MKKQDSSSHQLPGLPVHVRSQFAEGLGQSETEQERNSRGKENRAINKREKRAKSQDTKKKSGGDTASLG